MDLSEPVSGYWYVVNKIQCLKDIDIRDRIQVQHAIKVLESLGFDAEYFLKKLLQHLKKTNSHQL